MMLSPIAYTEEMVPQGIRHLLALNPLYYMIMAYQSVLMLGHFPPWRIILPFSIMSIFLFIFGYWFFDRMKQLLSDHV